MGEGHWRRPRSVLIAAGLVTLVLAGVLVARSGTESPVASPPSATAALPRTKPAETKPAGTKPAETKPDATKPAETRPTLDHITSWAYQLQDYPGGRLDQLAHGPYQLAVVDLARDAHTDYFTAAEINALRHSGKRALAYFEIGSIENFRPDYPVLQRDAPGVIANEWADWPGEYFVQYWDERWWELVVRPRVDQALRAGFDGVYLDTPLAYEKIDLAAAQGRDRDALGRAMSELIVRISGYAKARHPGFLIVPQNSPELRHYPGYTEAIDGIAMEELFFLATDKPCTEDWCAENLADTRALRDAGKFVLSVDYATRPADVRSACGRYRTERFAGTVTVLELDRLTPPCA